MVRKDKKRLRCKERETNASGNVHKVASFLWPLLAVFTIVTAGLLAYANTFTVPFVLDDVTSVLTNPLVKSFSLRLKPRILGDLSFALNYRLHGFELAGYHAINLGLHLMNACLVYLLVVLMFRTPVLSGYESSSPQAGPSTCRVIAFAAALIFVSHPIQTQAVTYIAQRVAVMATTFYLGSLVCYLTSRLSCSRERSALLLALSLLLAAAGVLSKENAVTIPLTVLLIEMTFFRGEFMQRLIPMVWYLLPLVLLPLLIVGRIGFTPDILAEVGRITAEQGAPQRLPYLLTQFPVVVSYLRLFFIPLRQNLDHDIPLRTSLADPVVMGGALVLLLTAALGCFLWVRGRRPDAGSGRWMSLAGFGIGWFFITLSVESSLIPMRDVMFEHRLYLPSVGLVVMTAAAGWGGASMLLRENRRIPIFLALFASLGLLLGSATFLRNRVWHDEVTLWRDVVAKSPLKARSHGSLGHALQRTGQAEEAIRCYREAVKLAPGDHIARNNLGTLYLSTGQHEAAMQQFNEALRTSPGSTQIHYNRGLTFEKLERLKEAEAAYEEAIRVDRRNDRALNNLGILQYRQGRKREAAQSFKEAVRVNPYNKQAADNLASLEHSEIKQ